MGHCGEGPRRGSGAWIGVGWLKEQACAEREEDSAGGHTALEDGATLDETPEACPNGTQLKRGAGMRVGGGKAVGFARVEEGRIGFADADRSNSIGEGSLIQPRLGRGFFGGRP